MIRKDKETNELRLELGPLKFSMKNAPRLAIVIVAIGICFTIVIYAHSWYRGSQRIEKIKQITSKILHGKKLTEEEDKFMDTLSETEEDKMLKNIERKGNLLKIKTNGLDMEQNVAPGTKVTVKKNGKDVEIRKGAPND